MIAALALLAAQVLLLNPSDDIWVYPHASDPSRDEYLRVWGVGGTSVAGDPASAAEYSYSYLKWDTSAVPKDAKLVEAKLILTHIGGPSFDLETAKRRPLEVRPVSPEFSEKGWTYELVGKLSPEKTDKAFFGIGHPDAIPSDAREFIISIDLLKGPANFREYFAKNPGRLALALTSKLDPSEGEARTSYKLYSKDAERQERRPVLRLVFEKP